MSLVLFFVIAGVPLYWFLRPAKQAGTSEVESASDALSLLGEANPHG
jgi:hypothetical protein